jgi:hypothetical protein
MSAFYDQTCPIFNAERIQAFLAIVEKPTYKKKYGQVKKNAVSCLNVFSIALFHKDLMKLKLPTNLAH